MAQTLYERLGGGERIAAIIEDSIDRHVVNPVLAPRFHGKDLPRLKQVGTQFVCAGIGGPEKYEGRDIRSVHSGMNISEQEYLATMEDIVAAMNAHGVGQAEVNEVIAILYSLKGDVLRV
jgi:hemoglobin